MQPTEYKPQHLDRQEMRMPTVHSTWRGLERVLPDIVDRFCRRRDSAIDFGVWYGYSTAALANCFQHVTGVDTFVGDEMAGMPTDLSASAHATMQAYPNVKLVTARWQDYILFHEKPVDLIHIDALHTYADTFMLGVWAIEHSSVVLFHDTESFPDVRAAVSNLAGLYERTFLNYPFHHGLGILVEGV